MTGESGTLRKWGFISVADSIRARAALAIVGVAALTVAVACKSASNEPPADADAAFAADGALKGAVNQAYADEVQTLCWCIPLGPLVAKPNIVADTDLESYLRQQLTRTTQPRTVSLLSRVLAASPKDRGPIVRSAFLGEAKPFLPTVLGPDPGAPTAPWGREDPKPRDWNCLLADRLDKLAR